MRRLPATSIVFTFVLAIAFGLVALGQAQQVMAASCKVLEHPPATEADKALLQGDYEKAVNLYQVQVNAHPADPDLNAGLVHALLHQQKVKEADDASKAALALSPQSPGLMTLRGEVEYRLGLPWTAAELINGSNKLAPCNPRTRLMFARLAQISSLYSTARQQILTAHQLDPSDPEIRSEWIGTLPLKQRITELEAYLSSPTGEDEENLRGKQMYLDHLKKFGGEPHKPCRLASSTASTEIPFIKLMRDPTHLRAYGLEVKLNNRNARLEIDTGAGGLLISRSVAERAGLAAFSKTEVSGIGDQGHKSGYIAYVDSIRIGNLEFQDCAVRVMDSRNVVEDIDGLIGMDVFARFLVTLDYPMRKLLLGPLPARPGEATAAAPVLKTDSTDADDSDSSSDSEKSPNKAATEATAAPASAPPKPQSHGPYDRYIAPEMKDYTPVYRVGHDLILPAALNSQKLKLFIMDTGAWTTTISPQAAREVTKVHSDDTFKVKGVSGEVNHVYSADEITFAFAHVAQKVESVASFDTSHISKSVGMEISGFIGATTLSQCTIHIDYRDGLVKFDYDPNRGYKY